MANRTYTEELNTLNVATAAFKEDVVVAINNDNYVSKMLLGKSTSFTGKGGKAIDQPLRYGREHVQTMDPFGEYNFQPVDILDQAQYAVKHVHGDMVLAEIDVLMNSGSAQLLSLIKTKNQNMADTMANKFSELLFTSVANLLDTDPESLIKICATLNNTVGGINAATETRFNWNPKALSLIDGPVTGAQLETAADNDYIEKIFQRLASALTMGKDKPKCFLVTQGLWNAYESALRAEKRFNDAYSVGDGGFDILKFRGIDVVVDNHVPGGLMNQTADDTAMIIGLNWDYLHYRHLLDFRTTEWTKAERQPVMFAGMDWMGALTCSRRDRQGAVLLLPTDHQLLASY
jgi:hypothetical protein